MGEKGNNPDSGFDQIKPVAIDLTARTADTPVAARKTSVRQTLIWLSLGLLLVSAALVIFLLPDWVTPPVSTPDAPSVPASNSRANANPAPARAAESPWEKAQESRLRRESQATLEQILEAQKLLSERGVRVWAEREYEQALQSARAGDELYNQGDFSAARLQYEQTLAALKVLQERVDVIFGQAIEQGKQALSDGDSAAAIKAFDLALAIDAIDREAMLGRERAEKLDQVMGLVRNGDRLLADGRFEEARQAYRQALELDEQSARAKQQMVVVGQKIQEQQFNARMSAGFTALYDGRLEKAEQEFTQALKVRPSSAEARSALDQSRHQLTARNIELLLTQAQTAEAQERWQEALAHYAGALKLDPGLAVAQSGKERATIRVQMQQRLEQILAHPDRLFDADVMRDTELFHRKILAVSSPGPVLFAQIDQLAKLLHKMSVPITVRFLSDNLTKVTLHKVSELGLFASREISLRPGRYVVVGVRDGYRDVRVEFILDPDKTAPVVDVRAGEKIAFGNES